MQYITSINQMQQISGRLGNNAKMLNRCNMSVRNVRVNIRGISNTLMRISQEIEAECQLLTQMNNMLNSSIALYKKYEAQIATLEMKPISSYSEDQLPFISKEIIWSKFYQRSFKDLWNYTVNWSNLWKVVGNAGAVGAAVSAVGTLITGQGTAKDYLSVAKYLTSAAGTGAVAVSKGGSEGLQYAVGWNDALAKIKPGSFGKTVRASVASQIDDLKFSSAKSPASNFKTATKWAGHVLTVAMNGVENYNEYQDGGISGGRAVAETVVESAVDITVGIGATAVATAAISALGVVSAPAVVVGAGAAAITIGANAVCKWATGGKDLGEVAADVVCDVGEGAVKIAKKAKNKVKEIFTAPWKGLCGAF